MQQDIAETVGLKALDWVLGDDALRGLFLGSTGATAADFGSQGVSPETLVAVLDFLCMDDAWVIAFCDSAGLAYTTPSQARAALPGGALPEWT